ncbi:hypothetical protein Enr13x_05070 [Stieleria neptunia]|uniref:Uncharacterized protein n=2 Tax=Stieleria neptunia TaxID=2527979 RepID=A0A518HIP0_9BACT|nr:hypothetical protein Enr13x_05070 [Stieleria neptunia]
MEKQLLSALNDHYNNGFTIRESCKSANISVEEFRTGTAAMISAELRRNLQKQSPTGVIFRHAVPFAGRLLIAACVFGGTIAAWNHIGKAPIENRVPGIDFKDPNGALDKELLSTFGDSFNYSNTLFSALAFAGVILTVFMQSRELSLQRKELVDTREELAGQKLATRTAARIQAISGIIQGYTAAYSANPSKHDSEYETFTQSLERALRTNAPEGEIQKLRTHVTESIRGQLDIWISELRSQQEESLG